MLRDIQAQTISETLSASSIGPSIDMVQYPNPYFLCISNCGTFVDLNLVDPSIHGPSWEC